MNRQQRTWLYNVQTTLNDAHMIVTDMVHAEDRKMSADENVLMDRIDMAIMHVHAMRQAEAMFDRPLHVRQT